MFRNKKRIESVEDRICRLKKETYEKIEIYLRLKKNEYEYDYLSKKLECVEKNTKALFEEYVISANNLVCPVCGDGVHIVIDDRFKSVFGNPSIQDDGTFVYKIKCNNHCVGVRDESITGAINKFKNLKLDGENDG